MKIGTAIIVNYVINISLISQPTQITPLFREEFNLLLIVRSTLPRKKDALVIFTPKILVDSTTDVHLVCLIVFHSLRPPSFPVLIKPPPPRDLFLSNVRGKSKLTDLKSFLVNVPYSEFHVSKQINDLKEMSSHFDVPKQQKVVS